MCPSRGLTPSPGFENAHTRPENGSSSAPQALLVHQGLRETGRKRVPGVCRDRQEVVKAKTEMKRMKWKSGIDRWKIHFRCDPNRTPYECLIHEVSCSQPMQPSMGPIL